MQQRGLDSRLNGVKMASFNKRITWQRDRCEFKDGSQSSVPLSQ